MATTYYIYQSKKGGKWKAGASSWTWSKVKEERKDMYYAMKGPYDSKSDRDKAKDKYNKKDDDKDDEPKEKKYYIRLCPKTETGNKIDNFNVSFDGQNLNGDYGEYLRVDRHAIKNGEVSKKGFLITTVNISSGVQPFSCNGFTLQYEDWKPKPPKPELHNQIYGTVKDIMGFPLQYAEIDFGDKHDLTNTHGKYALYDAFFSGLITVKLFGYLEESQYISGPESGELEVNFTLKSEKPPEPDEPEYQWWEDYAREKWKETIPLPEWVANILPDWSYDWIFKPFFLDPTASLNLLFTGKDIVTGKPRDMDVWNWLDVLSFIPLEKAGVTGLKLLTNKIPEHTLVARYADDLAKYLGKGSAKTDNLVQAGLKEPKTIRATIEQLEIGVMKDPKKMAKYFEKMGTVKFAEVMIGLQKKAGGQKAAAKLLDELWGTKNYILSSEILKNPAMIGTLLVTAIGSYPFAGFIKEEALQTLDFAIRTAQNAGDIESMEKLLEYKRQLLEGDLWDSILSKIPVVNVLNELRKYYDSALKKLEVDEKALEEIKEGLIPKSAHIICTANVKATYRIDGVTQNEFPTERFEFDYPLTDSLDLIIEAHKNGYDSHSLSANVEVGDILSYDFNLVKQIIEEPDEDKWKPVGPQKVIISCNVPAEVYLFGEPTGFKTGEEFIYKIGTHTFTIKAEGFVPRTLVAEIQEKDINTFEVALDELPPEPEVITTGKVSINSDVPARIWVSDGDTGFSTPHTFELEEGTYDFILVADGYYDSKAKAFVKAGEEYPINLILKKIPFVEPYIPNYVDWVEEVPTNVLQPYPKLFPGQLATVNKYYPKYSVTKQTAFSAPEKRTLCVDIETTGANPWDSRIICISCKSANQEDAQMISFYDPDEKLMLQNFVNYLEGESFEVMLGYNVSFDYRFLITKCMKHLVGAKSLLDMELRDVMQIMKQIKEKYVFGMNKSGGLADWMKFFWGIEKIFTFKTMLEAYDAGRIDDIIYYNRMDVTCTLELFYLFEAIYTSEDIPENIPTEEMMAPVVGEDIISMQCSECLSENIIQKGQKSYICKVCGKEMIV